MKKKVKIVDLSGKNTIWNSKGELKTYLIPLLITLVPSFIFWYLLLPAFNLKSEGFWFWLLLSLFIYISVLSLYVAFKNKTVNIKRPVILFMCLFLFVILAGFQGSRVFHAKRYSEILEVSDGEVELIPSVERTNSIALMDTESAERLGDRKIGSLSGVVSQYNVGSYIQIDYETSPVKRGIYSGGIGYINCNQDLDFALAIRTMFIDDEYVNVQSACGVVYDSVPEKELEETKLKARSLLLVEP